MSIRKEKFVRITSGVGGPVAIGPGAPPPPDPPPSEWVSVFSLGWPIVYNQPLASDIVLAPGGTHFHTTGPHAITDDNLPTMQLLNLSVDPLTGLDLPARVRIEYSDTAAVAENWVEGAFCNINTAVGSLLNTAIETPSPVNAWPGSPFEFQLVTPEPGDTKTQFFIALYPFGLISPVSAFVHAEIHVDVWLNGQWTSLHLLPGVEIDPSAVGANPSTYIGDGNFAVANYSLNGDPSFPYLGARVTFVGDVTDLDVRTTFVSFLEERESIDGSTGQGYLLVSPDNTTANGVKTDEEPGFPHTSIAEAWPGNPIINAISTAIIPPVDTAQFFIDFAGPYFADAAASGVECEFKFYFEVKPGSPI